MATGNLFHNRSGMKEFMKNLATILLILVLSLPFSFIITIVLFPFWSWIEANSGIESVGHSGPAEWCFYLVYLLLAGGILIGYWSGKDKEGN